MPARRADPVRIAWRACKCITSYLDGKGDSLPENRVLGDWKSFAGEEKDIIYRAVRMGYISPPQEETRAALESSAKDSRSAKPPKAQQHDIFVL